MTLSTLPALLLGFALFAGPVTPEKALQVAGRVFESAPATKSTAPSSLRIVWDGEFEPATKGTQDPAFYVVSRPEGGFVIVAGNDNVQPVLGFSFENDFQVEGMPDNVRWWMEELKGYARSAVNPTPDIEKEWSKYSETKAVIADVDVLETEAGLASRTNEWEQFDPANRFAPTFDFQENKTVCGCVSLALAEIMTWFGTQNKASFSGTIEGYTYQAYDKDTQAFDHNCTIESHEMWGEEYNWSALKALKTFNQLSDASEDLASDLGHLVYDIGTILQVEYNDIGTNGNLSYFNRLTAMMGYNQAATTKRRENYTSSEWISMLVAEITEHPVYYNGNDINNRGGHAFVADGFATKAGKYVVHFNFGWGGSCNGYYDCLTDLATEGGYDFFKSNAALFGFVPDPSGTTTPIHKLEFFCDEGAGGLSLKTGSSVTDNPVVLIIDNLENSGSTIFVGVVDVFRVNWTGERVGDSFDGYYFDETCDFVVNAWWEDQDLEVATLTNPVLGDKYALFYKEDGAYEYKQANGGTSGRIVTEVPYFPAAAIKKKASYQTGDYFVFELTNHSYPYGDSTWKVTDPSGTITSYEMGEHQVYLSEAGDYKISCTTPGQETVVTYITVE